MDESLRSKGSCFFGMGFINKRRHLEQCIVYCTIIFVNDRLCCCLVMVFREWIVVFCLFRLCGYGIP